MLALLVACVGCDGDARDANARFREAVADQDLVAAREAAFDMGRELPDTPEAVIELARLLAEIGEMNEARWLLEAATERHPGHEALIVGLAETSLRVGDAAAALAALDRLPADTPRAAYAEVLRARAVVQSGRLDEGLSILEAAEQRYGEPVLYGHERIDLLRLEDRDAEALAVVRAMQAHDDVPDAERAGLAVREAELVAEVEGAASALRLTEALLAADPAAVDAARIHTTILVDLGRAGEAAERLEAALVAAPEATALHALVAQAAMAAGDFERAERHLRAHADAEPSAAVLATLVNFLHQRGRTREAAALLEELPAGADDLQRIELRYQRIAMQIELGELDEARAAIEAFGRDHPRNPRRDYLLGRLDLAEGRPEAAAQRLALVVSRLDRSDVNLLLAIALERAGDFEGAELRYGLVATGGGASQMQAWAGLLRVVEMRQSWEQLAAVSFYAAQFAPLRDRALQAMARARLALGESETAEQIMRAHLDENAEHVESRVALAVALRRQGRLAEADAVLNEASPAQRRDPIWIAERATLLGRQGRAREALALLDVAEADGHAPPAIRHARIYLLFASGRADDALAEAARVAALDPDDPEPHRMAADYLASVGRFEASLEPYARAVELDPTSGDLALRQAIAADRAGREAEAVRAYTRAIELDPESVGARNNLALILGRAGRTREAIAVAQAAFARAEEEPVVIDTLASLYLDAGLPARAGAMLEKARRLDPESDEVVYHLALAYRDVGRRDDAHTLLVGLRDAPSTDPRLSERIDDALASLR